MLFLVCVSVIVLYFVLLSVVCALGCVRKKKTRVRAPVCRLATPPNQVKTSTTSRPSDRAQRCTSSDSENDRWRIAEEVTPRTPDKNVHLRKSPDRRLASWGPATRTDDGRGTVMGQTYYTSHVPINEPNIINSGSLTRLSLSSTHPEESIDEEYETKAALYNEMFLQNSRSDHNPPVTRPPFAVDSEPAPPIVVPTLTDVGQDADMNTKNQITHIQSVTDLPGMWWTRGGASAAKEPRSMPIAPAGVVPAGSAMLHSAQSTPEGTFSTSTESQSSSSYSTTEPVNTDMSRSERNRL